MPSTEIFIPLVPCRNADKNATREQRRQQDERSYEYSLFLLRLLFGLWGSLSRVSCRSSATSERTYGTSITDRRLGPPPGEDTGVEGDAATGGLIRRLTRR